VGALFLAWATSLPELVVTVSAIIIGSAEMGIGNIIGSNIFNLMILGLADILAKKGSTVFGKNDKVLIMTAALYLMSSLLFYMMSERELRRVGKIALIPVIMIFIYISSMVVIF